MKRLVIAAAAFSLMTMGALAQSSDPAWLDDLRYDIATQLQCEISYIVRLKEGELGAQKTYEARVQCADGRMFDASRIGEMESFKFKACEVQVC